MKIISDEKIAERAIVCWAALKEHERRSFQQVAQAQLEADMEEQVDVCNSCSKFESFLVEQARGKECDERIKKATENMVTPEEAEHLLLVVGGEIHIYGSCPICSVIIAKLKRRVGKDI